MLKQPVKSEASRSIVASPLSPGPALSRVAEAAPGAGQALDSQIRAAYESRFGHDFSRVRVHADGQADLAARTVNARAFTLGPNIMFRAGEYAPHTSAGERLLAHEMAHVVQHDLYERGGAIATSSISLAELEADRAADQVAAGANVGRLSAAAPRLARKAADYRTGEIVGKPGWTFVAYLDQGFVRLAFRVTDSTPDRRIGNIGWVTNNPGSLDLATPMVTDPNDKTKQVPAPPAQRVAVKEGAYEKNPDDIKTYRRFAVFPTRTAGENAIYPMLEVIARNNGNPSVDGLLRVYVRGTLKEKGAPDPLGDKYVKEIRSVLQPRFERRNALVHPEMKEGERRALAQSLTEGLLGRPFLDIHPGSWDAQFLIEAILKVESTRDLARVGLEYSCTKGFRNLADANTAYASAPGKLREIDKIIQSPEVKSQLDAILRCEERMMA